MKVSTLFLVVAGCAEPSVEMRFVAPPNAASYDTSCINAIEVRAIGSTFAEQDKTDFTRTCIELQSTAPTYAALREAIQGKFTVELPKTGLAGISVLGWSGTDACNKSDTTWYSTPNLAFYASSDYSGQDAMHLQAVPNLDCKPTHINARVV